MENLPVPTIKDLLTYVNKQTGKVEQIDLRTGKMYEPYIPVARGEFSNDLADLLLDEIRSGTTLAETCRAYSIPQSIFYAWLSIYPEFKTRYLEARKHRADYHLYKAIDLADSAVGAHKDIIPGLKVAVDTHKWAAEKFDPERFAKPKEEGNNGMGNITINLTTGVLDKEAPKDIVVDQFGNFQGFSVAEVVEEDKEEVVTVELSKNRFEILGE